MLKRLHASVREADQRRTVDQDLAFCLAGARSHERRRRSDSGDCRGGARVRSVGVRCLPSRTIGVQQRAPADAAGNHPGEVSGRKSGLRPEGPCHRRRRLRRGRQRSQRSRHRRGSQPASACGPGDAGGRIPGAEQERLDAAGPGPSPGAGRSARSAGTTRLLGARRGRRAPSRGPSGDTALFRSGHGRGAGKHRGPHRRSGQGRSRVGARTPRPRRAVRAATSGTCDRFVLNAAASWQYTPATVNGKPVKYPEGCASQREAVTVQAASHHGIPRLRG